jgi:hypothetical protein
VNCVSHNLHTQTGNVRGGGEEERDLETLRLDETEEQSDEQVTLGFLGFSGFPGRSRRDNEDISFRHNNTTLPKCKHWLRV